MNAVHSLLFVSYAIVLRWTCLNIIVVTEALQELSTFRRVTIPSNLRQGPSLLRVPPRIRAKCHVLFMRRYGPIDNNDNDLLDSSDEATPLTSSANTNDKLNNERLAFRKVVDRVLFVKDPQHIPSILTKNIELILSCMTTEDGALLVEAVIEDILLDQPDASTATTVLEAIDIIMSFGEEFVQYTSQIEKQNQVLLGKIIKIIAASSPTSVQDKEVLGVAGTTGGPSREEELDLLLEQERPHFTPGFLRHIENECQRIASAPSMTLESTRLLETLRIIQTRVLEEVCSQDLGEAAQVLGQIIGYDTKMERIAVLDAGLMVRGVSFAKELMALTTEALVGFQNVMNGADPDLVNRVQQIHDRLQEYITQYDPNTMSSTNTLQDEDSFA